ncbi:MAG: type IV secretory system conjugative DNA transfer family protein [Pseudonocardiales bacterium]|nr:type IV secretory system conjugative DNA transfer family protein [Pseudonocardiales bacterium]
MRARFLAALFTTPDNSMPHGWLARFLRDPAAAIHLVLNYLHQGAIQWGLSIGPALVISVGLLPGARQYWRHRCQQRLTTNGRLVTVLAPPTVDPAGATTVWSNLVGLLRPGWTRLLTGQPHLAWELVFSHDGVRVQLWVPGLVPPGMVERALEAAWPGAHTHTDPAQPPLPLTAPPGDRLVTVGGELRLHRSEALPIRTTFPADPTRALLGAPLGLHPHEHAVVQILARPVTGARLRKARHAGHYARPLSHLLDLITPHAPSHRRPASPDHQTSLETAAQDRAIVDKHRGAHYETRIRYALCTTIPAHATQDEHTRARERLRGRAHAIASAFAAFTEHNYYRRTRLHHPHRVLTRRHLGAGDLLSVPELAAIAHLPTDEAVPGLQRAGARAVPPPPGIATNGEGIKPIGRTDSGHGRPVGLHVTDARHHLHILGATGSGKSELMARMILTDAHAGRGLVVIDPKGDLISDVLARLPEHLGPHVVLFDADSRFRPPVLNPLEGEDQARTVDNLVSIFSRIYASSWGPRTEDILRSALLTLTHQPGTPTLTHLIHLLSAPTFRHRAIAQINDPVLAGFWSWYDQLSDASRAQVIAPLMNKVRGVLLRPFVRDAIAGGPSTVNMDTVLDGGICLVRIARNALGMETSRLLGSLVLARTWQAATRRARIPPHQRRDCSLYIDECHNFLTLPYPLEDMLAEARGYRLSITLAHQYLAQLPPDLEEGISTNARSKVFFTASPEDAKKLARHTTPRIAEHDLAHLGAFHIAARLVSDGEEAPAFTALTEKLPPPIPGRARQIRTAARVNTPQPPEPTHRRAA